MYTHTYTHVCTSRVALLLSALSMTIKHFLGFLKENDRYFYFKFKIFRIKLPNEKNDNNNIFFN